MYLTDSSKVSSYSEARRGQELIKAHSSVVILPPRIAMNFSWTQILGADNSQRS